MVKRASQVALVVKNPAAKAGDTKDVSPIPGSGRSSGVGNGTPLEYTCRDNSMNRGACQAPGNGVAESDRTKQKSTLAHTEKSTSLIDNPRG